MGLITDLSAKEARDNFLKGSSYFNHDLPPYISFEPIIQDVKSVLGGKPFDKLQKRETRPANLSGVNYEFFHNKDGRLAWRPFELIHPVIYVSLVNLICENKNWELIQERFATFQDGVVKCCSIPVVSEDDRPEKATRVRRWWHEVEQKSLELSLEFSHLLHTDVVDCYGSLYTHSIAWALHGKDEAKEKRSREELLGNEIDRHIRAGRYGQTNGICQGSVLMDFIAELVLGYVDHQISKDLKDEAKSDFRILRYRDDYRIFTNNDTLGEQILKRISDQLRAVGMKLGEAKTVKSDNIVRGSVKPDKLAGIELQELDTASAKTMQKQLLRLHQFGQRFPNSGALMRLTGDFHRKIVEPTSKVKLTSKPDDLKVQIAIAADIGFVSPRVFPAIAGILSHLISLAELDDEKREFWSLVRKKMQRIPFNGYLDIWLQRIILPSAKGIPFDSREPICQIVNGERDIKLWNNDWLDDPELIKALDLKKIVDKGKIIKLKSVLQPEEIELFTFSAYAY